MQKPFRWVSRCQDLKKRSWRGRERERKEMKRGGVEYGNWIYLAGWKKLPKNVCFLALKWKSDKDENFWERERKGKGRDFKKRKKNKNKIKVKYKEKVREIQEKWKKKIDIKHTA